MRLKEDIKPVTFMKTQAAQLLRSVEENRRPVVITQNGEPRGVLLDVDSYQRLRDTVAMAKLIGQSRAQLDAGEGIPQDEVFAELRQAYPDLPCDDDR